MQAIILAGGKGTRLYPLTLTVPKPMIPIEDKPFLYYLLSMLKKEGVSKVIFSIGYLGEQIKDYFSDNWNGLELIYITEKEPLGTGGAIAICMEQVSEDNVFVINGDTFCSVNLKKLLALHQQQKAEISIALKEMRNFDRYGTVEVQGHKIKQFNEKQKVLKGLINTGTYCLTRELFINHKMPDKFSFEMDFLQTRIHQINACAFISDAYFIDIGINEDYKKAQVELLSLV